MPTFLPDLLLVMLGFGFIIFIHELGHYLAARWAGIRVLAFAIGFGPPLLTYRRGVGLQRGSSEKQYLAAAAKSTDPRRLTTSPTEYRLNALPFGGYVKMLGQDDVNPHATSAEPDSYQSCPPWKRLVVISAGVVMNILLAAVLFIIVMMVGREVSAPRIGLVEVGSPAAAAAPRTPGVALGLKAGDEVLSINGTKPTAFDDLMLSAAMAQRGTTLRIDVRRGERQLAFEAEPKASDNAGILSLGVGPPRGTRVVAPGPKLSQTQRAEFTDDFARAAQTLGAPELEPGSELVLIAGEPAVTADAIVDAARQGGGAPLVLTFRDTSGNSKHVVMLPEPDMQTREVAVPSIEPRGAGPTRFPESHLLGMRGAVRVLSPDAHARAQGLLEGDILALVGMEEFPSMTRAMQLIRANKGEAIRVIVVRADSDGSLQSVELPSVAVTPAGRIGFRLGDTFREELLLAAPTEASAGGANGDIAGFAPGTRIVAVEGMGVRNYAELLAALRTHALTLGKASITVAEPFNGVPVRRDVWTGSRSAGMSEKTLDGLGVVSKLGWSVDGGITGLFEPANVLRKASNPLDALKAGVQDTKKMMLTTYLTFLRLVQGSVKVDQLKGPVGIAHLGTLVADRGLIWLLFFMALISVNLAVVNFLPLPIVDGGQFLFILYEWIRGKPVPVGVQNVVTLAGLALIGSMFLFVTYNDIRNLLGV